MKIKKKKTLNDPQQQEQKRMWYKPSAIKDPQVVKITINDWFYSHVAVCQNLVPLVNIKIAGKWMFIPLKMVLIGIDPYPCIKTITIWLVNRFQDRLAYFYGSVGAVPCGQSRHRKCLACRPKVLALWLYRILSAGWWFGTWILWLSILIGNKTPIWLILCCTYIYI